MTDDSVTVLPDGRLVQYGTYAFSGTDLTVNVLIRCNCTRAVATFATCEVYSATAAAGENVLFADPTVAVVAAGYVVMNRKVGTGSGDTINYLFILEP